LGIFPTASEPVGTIGWTVRATSHVLPATGKATVFAIGLKSSIPFIGTFDSVVVKKTTTADSDPSGVAVVPSGHMLTGCGASVHSHNVRLWKLRPELVQSSSSFVSPRCHGAAKIHGTSPGDSSVDVFAIGLRKVN
jgi:hypothetical protein